MKSPLWAALLLFAPLGCQEKQDHPPFLATCAVGQRCPVSIGIGSMGGPAGSGDPGGGEGGVTGDDTELTGTVAELVDDTFDTSLPYGNPAIVEGVDPDGRTVSAQWNGADPFKLVGVEAARVSWVSLRPQSGTQTLRTLHPVATNIRQMVNLGLVRTDTIEQIYRQFTLPQDRSPGAGQIVLIFTETQAGVTQGVADITVAQSRAEFAAYKSGGVWTDDDTRTDGSGLAILGNIPAEMYPGTSVRVTLGGSASGFVELQVASDAVTLVEIPLSP